MILALPDMMYLTDCRVYSHFFAQTVICSRQGGWCGQRRLFHSISKLLEVKSKGELRAEPCSILVCRHVKLSQVTSVRIADHKANRE